MNYATIGFERGEFGLDIVATLNNSDGRLSQKDFDELIQATMRAFSWTGEPVICLERQDTPDHIDLEVD